MLKDFDTWNEKKKVINSLNNEEVYFHNREVWWCSLGINVGFEQDGKGGNYERPVVILKKFNAQSALVIPLTTTYKTGKYYFPLQNLDGKNPKAILSQLRFVDRKRLINKIGMLSKEEFVEIKKAITKVNLL